MDEKTIKAIAASINSTAGGTYAELYQSLSAAGVSKDTAVLFVKAMDHYVDPRTPEQKAADHQAQVEGYLAAQREIAATIQQQEMTVADAEKAMKGLEESEKWGWLTSI